MGRLWSQLEGGSMIWWDQKWSFLAVRLDAVFGVNQPLHTITNTLFPLWSMAVAASCCGDVPRQQALKILEENLKQSARELRLKRRFFLPSETMTTSVQTNTHKTTPLRFWSGSVRAHTSAQLRICRWTWKWLSTHEPHAIWENWSFWKKNGENCSVQMCEADWNLQHPHRLSAEIDDKGASAEYLHEGRN